MEVASRLKSVYFRYYRQNDDCPGVEEKVEVHLLHSYRYLFFEIVSREKRGGGAREERCDHGEAIYHVSNCDI